MNPMTVPTPDGTWTFTPSAGMSGPGGVFGTSAAPPFVPPVLAQPPAGIEQIAAHLLPVLLPRLLQALGPLLGGVGAATGNPAIAALFKVFEALISHKMAADPNSPNPVVDNLFDMVSADIKRLLSHHSTIPPVTS